ncbi:MAG TPA: TatD family hydrolase [bacterium]|nr:TatD family hydrolase [bacterium]
MRLIDTHVHLDDTRYEADREALIARAAEAGVDTLVTIGTDLADSKWAADFVAGRKNVYGTVGQHPERVGEFDAGRLDEFRRAAQRPGIVAIGEVGLDYHSPGFDAPAQQRLFGQMIGMARDLRLPLVIHNRDAGPDTLAMLRERWDPSLGGVFHCFAGDQATADGALALGFDLAVGACSPTRTPSRCGTSSPPCRWSAWCWRPTAPGWRPRPGAASAMSRPTW